MNFKRDSIRILGIDPGLEGAAAVIDGAISIARLVDAVDLPTIGEGTKRTIDERQFHRWLGSLNTNIDIAIIEYVSAMPGWGAGGSFRFGMAFGALRAIVALHGIPYYLVTPTKWKKYYDLKGGDKESSRQKACQLFPTHSFLFERKKDHQRAEAALLANYGFKFHVA